jgi:hypothetical protein
MQSRESARKTANLLLRIARYTPLPPHPTHPTHPTRPDAPPPRASSPRERGEDRLATGQAPCQATEGTDAHLSAHAVQYKAAAPTKNPTPQRVTTTTPHPPRAASCTSNKTTSSPQHDRPIARAHRDTS